MKVICDSCGSKYQIKDEKVRGKRVKIRCKGCKNAIVVDGTTVGEGEKEVRASVAPPPDTSAKQPEPTIPEPAATPAPQAASADVSPAASPAAPDAQPSPAPAAAAVAPAAQQAAEPSEGESSPSGATAWTVNLSDTDNREMTSEEILAAWKAGSVTDDAYVFREGFDDWTPILDVPELARLVGSSAADAAPTPFAPPAGPSPFGASAAARAATAERSGDMFGAAATASASEPPAPMFPSAGAGKGAGAGTGARNESSVLFSLDALKAGFSAPAPTLTTTSNDDPFDLGGPGSIGGLGGSLAANQALLSAPPPEPKKRPKPKPVVAKDGEAAPAPALSRNKLIMIGVGAVAAMILVGVLGFALGGGSGDEAVAKNEVTKDESDGKVRTGKANEKADDDKEAKADDGKKDEGDAKGDKEAKADDDKEAKADDDKEAKANDDKKDDKGSTASKSGGTTSAKDDKKPEKKAEAKPEKQVAAAGAFDKGAARAALASAAANAASCKIPGGPTGSGKAIVTFAPSGRVTTANVVGGKFGGTSVGGCVASRFRRSSVPPFSGGPITVSKSFTIQ
jgi:predicted Zn finger-like uncharacterized protein